jgi:FAD/FMN-containing dehydrogenase
MRTILDVDPGSFTITAEAGVTIQELQDAARTVDREFAVDWGARGSATVGGAVSTDAGGINVLRSGTMRDQVLGLEVVLPDGQVWDGLRSLRKDASGYGLKHLFIGAEGTLGLVTKVVLKLEPRRSERQSFFAAVTDFSRLTELYALAQDHFQHSLAAFELIPELGVQRVCAKYPTVSRPMSAVADWYVLGQLVADEPVVQTAGNFLVAAAGLGLISDEVVAQTSTQEQNLWNLRDELPPDRIFDQVGVKFDVAVPTNRLAAYYTELLARTSELDRELMVYAFGHLGDGNLHLYVMLDSQSNSVSGSATTTMESQLKHSIIEMVDALTWQVGGTISAEHGVGQELRDRMVGQKSAVELELLAKVKQAIDPEGLFNPNRGAHGSVT